MTLNERWGINNGLIKEARPESNSGRGWDDCIRDFNIAFKEKKEAEIITNSKVIMQADIVAMTTTGCAKFHDLLSKFKFPIVIVEEAAEVFEGHVLSSISEHTEHMILIGDH